MRIRRRGIFVVALVLVLMTFILLMLSSSRPNVDVFASSQMLAERFSVIQPVRIIPPALLASFTCERMDAETRKRMLQTYAFPFAELDAVKTPEDMEFLRVQTRYPFDIASLDHGDLITRTLKSKGVWESHKIKFIEGVADKMNEHGKPTSAMTFVDVGANIGAIGFVARSMGMRTFMVEPVEMHIAMIRSTAIRNDFIDPTRFFILPFAFGNDTGTSTIQIIHSNHGGSTLVPEKVAIEKANIESTQLVRLEQLDDWINFPVDILKIDVEGFEKCVIEGALRLFYHKRVKYVIMEVWWNIPLCNSAVGMFEWLVIQGYTIYTESEWEQAIARVPPKIQWKDQPQNRNGFSDWIMVRNE